MTRCLITGIGGSIGCHVFAHIMHNTDWHVVGIDSFRHKGLMDRTTVMTDAHPEWKNRLTLVVHDLRAPISSVMANRIGEIDYIINLASLPDVFDSIQNPAPFALSNAQIMINVLEFARNVCMPACFLHISTDEVYGPTDGTYFHEEWEPLVPSSPYSASKVGQEALAIAYWRAYKLPLMIVNLMNNFGEMQAPSKFPAIIQRKLAAGETITIHGDPASPGTRFYIHSRNSADSFLFLMRHHLPYQHQEGVVDKPERYNIVGNKQVSNLDLVKFIADVLHLPPNYVWEDFKVTRPGHDHHYGLDGSKIAVLGWAPPVSFEKSMYDTVLWTKDHPEWLNPRS